MEGDITAIMGMVILQVCYAGLSITSKLAMQSGMNPLVLLTYRQFFGTLAIAPFAFFTERYSKWMKRSSISGFEKMIKNNEWIFLGSCSMFCFFGRKTRPKITFPVLVQIFICSLSGWVKWVVIKFLNFVTFLELKGILWMFVQSHSEPDILLCWVEMHKPNRFKCYG